MTIRDQFPRTSCDCELCQIGCTTMPGTLASGDLERIAEYLGEDAKDADWLASHFAASDGGKLARFHGGKMETRQTESIVPRQRASGACVFYRGGRCSIHPVSPAGCAICDMHMEPADGE